MMYLYAVTYIENQQCYKETNSKMFLLYSGTSDKGPSEM